MQPCNIAETTIIIDPGSYCLRIGRASEQIPRKFLHCIARRISGDSHIPKEPIIVAKNPFKEGMCYLDLVRSSTVELLKSKAGITTPVEKNSVNRIFELLSPMHVDRSDLPEQEFFVLNDAMEWNDDPRYHLTWPLRFGLFSQSVNYTSVLQDLEDIWTTAIERHLNISRNNFHEYRVILIIGDVFRRGEIRHLVDLLLSRLGFGNVFLHQSSVCATFGVGLPTACVVEVGEQKTSVSLVDDGFSHPDSRVTLFVGRGNILRTFDSLVLGVPTCDDKTLQPVLTLDYCCASDVATLRSLFNEAEKAAVSCLNTAYKQMTDDDPAIAIDHLTVELALPSKLQVTADGDNQQQADHVTVPISKIIAANLLPFAFPASSSFGLKVSGEHERKHYECQLSSMFDPQPDDAFDDLYLSMTARERRKRACGSLLPAGGDLTQPAEVDVDPNDKVPSTNFTEHKGEQSGAAAPSFSSLPDAVWWSIHRYAQFTFMQGTEGVGSQPTSLALEERIRRLLGCIILLGDGLTDTGKRTLQTWLTDRLTEMAKNLQVIAGNAAAASATEPTVEVISNTNQDELVWTGARLLLTTDIINDLWITQAEWLRFGSRAIREKGTFRW